MNVEVCLREAAPAEEGRALHEPALTFEVVADAEVEAHDDQCENDLVEQARTQVLHGLVVAHRAVLVRVRGVGGRISRFEWAKWKVGYAYSKAC